MPRPEIIHKSQDDRDRVLTEALFKAADIMGISRGDVGVIIGESEATISRSVRGLRAIKESSKAGELAVIFLRAFRSLDAIVGGKEEAIRHWFHTENQHLGGVPAEIVKSAGGLANVSGYLDAMRGKV